MTDSGISHQIIKKDNTFSIYSPGVKLSTIHAAKGLEFTNVIIPEFTEGNLSKIYEKEDEEIIQEEIVRTRNIAYVCNDESNVKVVYYIFGGAIQVYIRI